MAQPQAASDPRRQEQHRHLNGAAYQRDCKACAEADAIRSARDKVSIPAAAVERTTFLIPGIQYESLVCRAYLREKYPDADPRSITSGINLSMLTGWDKDDQIVVVRRMPGPKGFGPSVKRGKDEENKWADIEIPPETYLSEVVESAPLMVDQLVIRSKANRYVAAKADHMPLVDRISELLVPYYRVDMPRNTNGEGKVINDDCMMRVVRS